MRRAYRGARLDQSSAFASRKRLCPPYSDASAPHRMLVARQVPSPSEFILVGWGHIPSACCRQGYLKVAGWDKLPLKRLNRAGKGGGAMSETCRPLIEV